MDAMARIFQPQMSYLFFNILMTGRFWTVVLAGPVVALLPDIFLKGYRQVFHATSLEVIIRQRRIEALSKEISVVPDISPLDEKDHLKPLPM